LLDVLSQALPQMCVLITFYFLTLHFNPDISIPFILSLTLTCFLCPYSPFNPYLPIPFILPSLFLQKLYSQLCAEWPVEIRQVEENAKGRGLFLKRRTLPNMLICEEEPFVSCPSLYMKPNEVFSTTLSTLLISY
jgi:hypothetical protein